jgi:hypothetical protein
MDDVQRLIQEFRSEDTTTLGDFSKKVEIITDLEYMDDQRIMPFFLEIVSDENEYDLARIEVLKILRLKEPLEAETDEKIARILTNILSNSADDDVRIYAAMTASTYTGFVNLVEVLSTIIFDDQEDINLRWNAITSIEEMGDTEQSRRIMEKALPNNDFQDYAKRILNEWSTK